MNRTKEPWLGEDVHLEETRLGDYTSIGAHSTLENSSLDHYSYCEPYCIIQNTQIKRYVDIARNVRIGATQHPLDRPTTHHFTYRRRMYGMSEVDDEAFFEKRRANKTVLGNDVWIGHGAVIESGIHIGDGAVVGSGAIVTHDVPPYAIVAGVPARILRYRFSKQEIDALLDICWWDWDDEVLRVRFDDFLLDIASFIEKYKKG